MHIGNSLMSSKDCISIYLAVSNCHISMNSTAEPGTHSLAAKKMTCLKLQSQSLLLNPNILSSFLTSNITPGKGTVGTVLRACSSGVGQGLGTSGLTQLGPAVSLTGGCFSYTENRIQEFSPSCCLVEVNYLLLMTAFLFLRYFPFGIVFLIAGKILEMDDPSAIGKKLGFYAITVVCGLVVHGLFILPMMYFFITKKNPIVFIRGILQALLIALATSSRYYLVSVRVCQHLEVMSGSC